MRCENCGEGREGGVEWSVRWGRGEEMIRGGGGRGEGGERQG